MKTKTKTERDNGGAPLAEQTGSACKYEGCVGIVIWVPLSNPPANRKPAMTARQVCTVCGREPNPFNTNFPNASGEVRR